ncbi:MAG: DNA repair protein RecN [bacterium]
MLEQLNITNFALIENLILRFSPKFTVLTGETGAGKSILIEALGLILGDRASPGMIRTGADSCEINGIFELSKFSFKNIKEKLDGMGIMIGGEEPLIIRRVIETSGRSRAYVNDHPVNLATLYSLGENLVDIHGQNEHQTLIKTAHQRAMLDEFAGNNKLIEDYQSCHSKVKELKMKLEKLAISDQEKNQKLEIYSYQLNEIEQAQIKFGEEEEIERLLPQLKNKDKIETYTEQSCEMLYEGDGAVLEKLRGIQKSVEQLRELGADIKDVEDNLEKAQFHIEEIFQSLREYRNGLDSNQYELNYLLERQEVLNVLKRKYGSDTRQILEYAENLKQKIQSLEYNEENKKEEEAKLKVLTKELETMAKKLTASRKTTGRQLSSSIEKELKDLGLEKSKIDIRVEQIKDEFGNLKFSDFGTDKVEIYISPNPGEDMKPLREVASGGEISRIMLGIRKVLTEKDQISTLVYDEIDNGIGGSMGYAVGDKLAQVSKKHQVICITHLPQLAACADQHIFVGKQIVDNRTMTSAKALNKNERLEEIARMLDGDEVSPISIKHAREMLVTSQKG